ncbi:unnamed protein product [Linum trigynum]|uniref:Uncharacterized protein n=1 Tax=Linum trigynum TaxID=586398 RepID=A0AAV2F1J1_9ROSI
MRSRILIQSSGSDALAFDRATQSALTLSILGISLILMRGFVLRIETIEPIHAAHLYGHRVYTSTVNY